MIVCKICGGKVADEVACCSRCFTPHHFDCWSFSGQCSIYGCGSKDHRYFDFRDKSEAEVLAVIGKSLALAIREDAATLAPEAGPAPAALARPDRPAVVRAGGSTSPEPRSADDLMEYKRRLYRSLHSLLQKVSPEHALPQEALPALEETAGTSPLPALYLADDLAISEPEERHSDLEDKRRLVRSMARRVVEPDPPGALERLMDGFRRAWRRLFE